MTPVPIVYGLLLLAVLGLTLAHECGPCTCTDTDDGIDVNCTARNMTSIPDHLPAFTSHLDFSENRLAPENINGLCGFALVNVNLSGNQLTSLSSHQFDRCYITGQIDLRENLFDTVSESALAGLLDVQEILHFESRNFHPLALSTLTNLRELSIILHQTTLPNQLFSGLNHVHTLSVDIRNAFQIPEAIFRPLSVSLKNLTLITNSLPFIGENILRDCALLDTFVLHARNLNSVPASLFNSTPSLTRVSMRGVGSVPRYVFANLDRLTRLEMHGAEDMSSDVFVGLLKLKQLDLSECSIPTIPRRWFQDLWSLESLNLANVGLQTLTSSDLLGLSAIIELNLSGNNLRKLDPFVFSDIKYTIQHIVLSRNSMKEISDGTFAELEHLETLDLASNQIHSISTEAFTSLEKLKALNLHDNKIYIVPNGVFDSNSNLEVLDLSSNVISESLPSVFESLHSLRVLNISDNLLVSVTYLQNYFNSFTKTVDLSLNQLQCECVSKELTGILADMEVIGTCWYKTLRNQTEFKTFTQSTECELKSTTTMPSSSTTTISSTATDWPQAVFELVKSSYEEQLTDEIRPSSSRNAVDDGVEKSRDVGSTDVGLMPSFTTPSGYTPVYHDSNMSKASSTNISSTAGIHYQQTTTGHSVDYESSDDYESAQEDNETTETTPSLETLMSLPTVLSSTRSSNNPTDQIGAPPVVDMDEFNNQPEASLGETETSKESYYIAVACICTVSLACILILIYLFVRNLRRQRGYEVSHIEDQAIDSFIMGSPRSRSTAEKRPSISLKEVPSIQIDTVDNENNENKEKDD